MAYIGNEPSVNFTSFAKQDITGDGGASYTLTYAVASANEIEVFVNNVRQEPSVAYTVSGTALSMTGNVASTDDFYVIYLGKALQTTVPPDGSVTSAKISYPLTTFSSTGIDDNATSTAMTLDSNGRVGIGGTPLGYPFEVYGGNGDGIVFRENTNSVVNWFGGLNSLGTVGTGSNHSLAFYTNGSERMRVDTSGNLLVGKTSNDSGTASGTIVSAAGVNRFTADGNHPLVLKRLTSDGTIVQFEKDSTIVGSINSSPSVTGIFIGNSNTGLTFYDAGSSILPATTTGLRDNGIDLGNISNRFDDIYATNGTIQTSDQNEKNTITDSDLGIDFIKRLTPKSYIFNGKTRTHYGLIAQDVETVLTDINKPTSGFAGFIKDDISEEQDGSEYRYGLRYEEFIAPLIQAVKDQQAIIEDLQARITALENS